ncbi:CCA tRNA nucleotidyltransferase [Blattabacterium cuenoti]|uniref:CCA tRNA nucleotidyltransferase n=1 Tax=Blattabacterium cuenoti TaxID=1653831 RepID=UPI00163CB210|nr:HD domain-containing protein [Blattabacterium cuenoti]
MNLSSFLHKEKIFKIVNICSKKIKQNSYVVGGYVRDILLGKLITEDIDIITIGEGRKLAIAVANAIYQYNKYYPKIIEFQHYGTAMLKYHDKKIEFVGSRKELYTSVSRNPIIMFGSLKDDQKRRDFTVNSLAISLNDQNYGDLIDPFDGLSDLQKGILRTPLNSDITYSDDPLRMMRAIRFATQLHFCIEKKSFDAIKNNKKRISIVSSERIIDEFNKILLSDQPSIGLFLLYKSGLLSLLLPELVLLKGIDEKNQLKHKDNFYHTLQVIDNISKEHSPSLWLRWSALLHDIGKPFCKSFFPELGWTFHSHEFIGSKMIENIFQRLKLPKGKIMNYIKKMVLNSYRTRSLIGDQIQDSSIRRLLFDMGSDLEDLIKLSIADITTIHLDKMIYYKKNIFSLMDRMKHIELKDRVMNWKSPISGYDIMNTFHIKPCKEIGIIKNYIKEAILEGRISNSFHEAYFLMLKEGKKLGFTKKI